MTNDRFWGIFLLFKPVRILIFIIIFNAIAVAGILFEGRYVSHMVQTIGGSFMLALEGAFMGFCGFAPMLSQRIRVNWCNPDTDFERAKAGLVCMGIIGSFFALIGVFLAVSRLVGPKLLGQ